MNGIHVYTRRAMGLDKGVWLSMLMVFIISAGLLSYRLTDMKNAKPCLSFDIYVTTPGTRNDSLFTVGEMLLIKAAATSDPNLAWDYGDGSQQETGLIKTHKYENPGIYSIVATLEGRCETIKKIVVTPAHTEQSLDISAGTIIGNTNPTSGLEETYISSLAADSYEWIVLNNPRFAPQKSSSAKFLFPNRGNYTIQLVLNGNRLKAITKNIAVVDPDKPQDHEIKNIIPIPSEGKEKKSSNSTIFTSPQTQPPPEATTPQNNLPPSTVPAPAEPAKKNIKKIPPRLFQDYLEAVITGEKTASDFYPYLFYQGGTKVQINNDKIVQFQLYCSQIYGNKKLKIKSVDFTLDENGYIQVIKIKSRQGIINKDL